MEDDREILGEVLATALAFFYSTLRSRIVEHLVWLATVARLLACLEYQAFESACDYHRGGHKRVGRPCASYCPAF
jgi:hypothetical protein